MTRIMQRVPVGVVLVSAWSSRATTSASMAGAACHGGGIQERKKSRGILRALGCVLVAVPLVVPPITVFAQAFPTKPVRMIVPYEPGGAVDIVSRTVAPKFSEALGQPVVIENRSGAGGQIGTQFVARSAPDGYTIMSTIGGAHVLSMYAFKNLPYHPIRDFTAITALADTALCIAASSAFPPNSIQEMIDFSKRNPGKVSYGHTGVGGVTHLAMENIRVLSGADMVHIPFKGGGPMTVNLVGGQLQMAAMPLASLTAHIKAGKVKVLAILGTNRYPGLPAVPTAREGVPGFEMLEATGTWAFAPAGLPQPVLMRLNSAFATALNTPEVRDKLEAGGQLVVGNSPAEIAALIQKAVELGGRLMKAAGVQPE